jgi:hypothetical protein
MKVEKEEIRDLLIRLKKINQVYAVVDEKKKGRLLELSEPLIRKLMAMGFEEVFIRTLLIGGKDFLDSLYGNGEGIASEHDVKIIFS